MRYETHTHLNPERVLDEAEKFFGPDGLKMTRSARQAGQIAFFGEGLAWVTVWPPVRPDAGSRVDLDSSQRDAEVLAFRLRLHTLEHETPPPLATGPSPQTGPR